MANSGGYIVRRSNYTLLQHHKSLSSGTIYVRDYMTTNGTNWAASDTLPYGESNFRIIRTRQTPTSREHGKNNWVLWCDGSEESPDVECDVWTYNTISDDKSTESEIKIKPDYSTLRDFVYYGSCVETIKNAIKHIITTFPGELYVTDIKYGSFRDLDNIHDPSGDTKNEEEFVVVSNPFNINISSLRVPSHIPNLNRMRFFCNYFGDVSAYTHEMYNLITFVDRGDVIEEVIENLDWNVERFSPKCGNGQYMDGQLVAKVTIKTEPKASSGDTEDDKSGDFVIYQFYKDREFILLTEPVNKNKRIRPNEEYITDFFNNLIGVEQLLLNPNSNPKYTTRIEYPFESEYGILTRHDDITWHTDNGGWNIIVDANMDLFRNFVNKLLGVAEAYDEYYTNNLWKNMVHPSIKNMDLTYVNEKTQEDSTDFNIGLTKMEKLMYSYGIFFDIIKRHIDNIKTVNKISYNGYNNNPDYFLSDMVDMSGWEVYSAVNGLNRNAVTDEDIFPGLIQQFTTNDANVHFLRNLKINSKNILLNKGTREGLEEIFALFGLTSYDFAESLAKVNGLPTDTGLTYDYKIDEFICVAKPRTGCTGIYSGTSELDWTFDVDDDANVEVFNTFKNTYNPEGGKLEGLPLATVYCTKTNDSGDTYTIKYFVPWFNNGTKYDGDLYYQMNGGWGSTDKIILNSNTPSHKLTAITADDEYKLYDETVRNLIVVSNVHDLTLIPLAFLRDGMIVKYEPNDYSLDLDRVARDIEYEFGVTGITDECSNYFILRNKDYSNYYSDYGIETDEVDDGVDRRGWENIPQSELEMEGSGMTTDAKKVLYVENIIEDKKANNPHDGYWKYDSGKEYIEYFDKIFKYSIENNNFNSNAYYCNSDRTAEYEDENPCNQCNNLLDEISCIGFDNLIDKNGNVNYLLDNMKCWFFSDGTKNIDAETEGVPVYTKYNDEMETISGITEIHRTVECAASGNTDLINHVGEIPIDEMYDDVDCAMPYNATGYTETTRLDSEFTPFDFESDDNEGRNNESAANSIINTKGVRITFNLCGDEETIEERVHLYQSILKYAKQVIPSGAILETVFNIKKIKK